MDYADEFDAELHAALALDAEELAYLGSLGLPSRWRTSPAPSAVNWGWIALAVVVAGFVAWWLAAPAFGFALATAAQVGVGTVLLNAALVFLFGLGEALLELSRNPLLGLSQPLLALLALALLVWPHHLIPQRSTPS